MNAIERVARAIAEADPRGLPVHWDHWDDYQKGPFRFAARAAIAAMREPTDEMVNLGAAAGEFYGNTDAKATWQAMIDSALKEKVWPTNSGYAWGINE